MKNLQKLRWRQDALKQVNDLFLRADSALLIHYSCESFTGRPSNTSARITSIAVRNLASGQTQSFSIQIAAEEGRVPSHQLLARYDELERSMLDRFFQFVAENRTFRWLHWNMRDMQYGFAAIEHRHRVLGGTPTIIPEGQKLDLARVVVAVYGIRYMNHPRFKNLCDANDITTLDFMSGEEEALAFEKGQYTELHRSTLRKVDCMEGVLQRLNARTLVTRSSRRDIYGQGVLALIEWLREHPLFPIAGIIGGAVGFASAIYGFLK